MNVVMPGYVKAFASTGEPQSSTDYEDMIVTTRTAEVKCRNVIFLTTAMSSIFVIATTIAAAVALKAKQNMIDKYYISASLPSLPVTSSTSASNTVVSSRSSVSGSCSNS